MGALGLTGCSGGVDGGSGDTGGSALSAGANRTALTSQPLSFTAIATEASAITEFQWRQTAGLEVSLSAPLMQTVSLVTPERAAILEFEVIGFDGGGEEVARDRVVVDVSSTRPELLSELRSVIDVRGGGEGRAIGSAVHTASQRLFVIDGVGGDVLAYDVSSPSAPDFLGAVAAAEPTIGFSPGAPLSVAAGDSGAVAITWSGETPEFPGVIQLIDPGTLQTLVQVSTTGANPVDVEVTADGQLFAVACAGDAVNVGGGDGFGYITLLRIPAGGPGAVDVHGDLFPVVLNPFDGSESALAQSGIRFFKNNPVASVELTPRSVTISPDGQTVWASCPENDALVVIDSTSRLITDLVPLEDRSFGRSGPSFEASAFRFVNGQAPAITTTPTGEDIPFGGVTGIVSMSVTSSGPASIRTVSAAGPALGAADRNGNGTADTTLIDPGMTQAIQTALTSNLTSVTDLTLVEASPLTGSAGEPITGRPGLFGSAPGLAGNDEETLDLLGDAVQADPFGARFGGATSAGISGNGGDSIWLGEMRRNGLWRFSPSGQVIERYVPEGTPAAFGTGSLPAVFAQRRLNLSLEAGQRYGGFGAVGSDPVRGSIFAAPRLPLDNPDTAGDTASRNSRIARMVEVASADGSLVGEYVLVLEATGHALEGMTYLPGNPAGDEGLFMLEASTAPGGFRGIYRIDVEQATNLRTLSAADYAAVSAVLETTAPGDLAGLPTSIVPVQKTLRADLRAIGLDGGMGQPSALGSPDGVTLYVAFDDGHQLLNASVAPASGRVTNIGSGGTQFGSIALPPNAADFSGASAQLELFTQPIEGLTQPLDLVAIESDGVVQLLTADGGFARVLEPLGAGSSFDERLAVGGLLLDTNVFTNPALVQSPQRAGNLSVSSVGGDANSDGLVDHLLAFGGRSISVRDRLGRQQWHSTRALERRAFEQNPDAVLGAATLYGIRPSSLAVGTLGGRRVLAAGLEGASTVMLYDLSQPSAPLLSGVGSRAIRPVDVDIAAIGGTMLFVTDSASGRIEIRRLTLSL